MGYLTFTPGAVFTAAQAQEIMDQTVIPFADATARDVAIPSPTQGMIIYNQSNDRLETYDGTIWQAWTKRYAANGPTSGLNVNNTTSETTIASEVLNGPSLKAGAIVRLKVFGGISATGTPTFTVRFKIGGNTVATIGPQGATAVSNREILWEAFVFFYSVGVSGQASVGASMFQNANTGGAVGEVQADFNNLTSTSTVDTTGGTVSFACTFQWSAASASNLFTRKGYIFERIV